MVVLITGGARSGKSLFAEKYAAHIGTQGIYIATTEILDDEMQQRVQLHQDRRKGKKFQWDTLEEPYELIDRIQDINKQYMHSPNLISNSPVVLVDCLTLWLSNWLLRYEGDETMDKVLVKISELVEILSIFQGQILLVTNEVGNGVVPEYPLGRQFRDLAGMMNQWIAAISRQVFLVTAGIPVELKGNEFKFEV